MKTRTALQKAFAPGLLRGLRAKGMSPSQLLWGGVREGQPYYGVDSWDITKSITQGYKANAWVAACLNHLIVSGSSVPWTVELRRSDGSWKREDNHDLGQLVEYPNPRQTRKYVIGFTLAHLALGGNGIQKIVLAGGKPAELWTMHPRGIAPIPDDEDWVTAYRVQETGGKGQYDIPAEEIVHAQLPDPDNPLWGTGLLRPAWKSVEASAAGQDWRLNVLGAGGIPPGAIIDRNIVDDQQAKRASLELEKRWRAAGQGGRPLLLTAGTEYLRFGITPADFQQIEAERYSVWQIVAAFGLSMALFAPEAMTYDNQKAARRAKWTDGVLPLLDVVCEALNLALVPPDQRRDVWITYDLSDVEDLEEDRTEKLAAVSQAIRAGVPRDTALELVGLPLDGSPGGKVPLVDAGLVRLEDLADGGAGLSDGDMPDEDPATPDDLAAMLLDSGLAEPEALEGEGSAVEVVAKAGRVAAFAKAFGFNDPVELDPD